MKENVKRLGMLLLAGMLICSNMLYAQKYKGDGNVVNEEREIGSFDEIDAGGAFDIILVQGDEEKLVLKSDANLMEHVITENRNGKLMLSTKGIRNFTELEARITFKELNELTIHGASEVKSEGTLQLDEIKINVSGASETSLDLAARHINITLSGASEADLSGTATRMDANVSGASELTANKLVVETVYVDASGASQAYVNATKELMYDESGAADIKVQKMPPVSKKGSGIRIEEDEDEVRVISRNIEVKEDADTTNIRVGSHTIVIDDAGNVQYHKTKRYPKFNGHWGGFDLGINGYFTPDYDMNFGPGNEYLDLNMAKSIKVGLNIFEQNLSLTKNQKLGLITGIGLEINNYRFDDDVSLTPDSARIRGFYNSGVVVSKSKLVVSYLEVPVLLEFQNNSHNKSSDFHLTAGMIFGLRITSHTKQVFEEQHKTYTLIDPETNNEIIGLEMQSPGNEKVKIHDDFHLNPFKADATVRLGWGWINLFGTYSLTTLFKENKGPELYPFSIGLTLTGW